MAMLTALLLVALAASLAVNIWYGTALDVARMQNTQQAYQAKHLSQGLLLWASDVLRQDYENADLPWDNRNDAWRQGVQQMPADGAMLSGTLLGLNDCFNINNLWQDGVVSEPHYQYFKRLLQLLNIELAVAEQAIDWMDPDQIPRQQGAEDFAYLAASPSYQTGGQAFWHESQLNLLQAVTPTVYRSLKPYVCVLPVLRRGASKMNINTLSPVMIRALHPNISEALALSIYQEGGAAFSQLSGLYQHGDMAVLSQQNGVKEVWNQLLSVQTLYIQAEAEVVMENSIHDSYALLFRNDNGAAITLQRAQSPFRQIDTVE